MEALLQKKKTSVSSSQSVIEKSLQTIGVLPSGIGLDVINKKELAQTNPNRAWQFKEFLHLLLFFGGKESF